MKNPTMPYFVICVDIVISYNNSLYLYKVVDIADGDITMWRKASACRAIWLLVSEQFKHFMSFTSLQLTSFFLPCLPPS